jgi:D-glycero-alpha-D-manno-heptose-7-phosphate kinase
MNSQKALDFKPVTASAPCRLDMGGTLDIRTFSYPLQHLEPCTVNIALDLRTTVTVAPHTSGRVHVSSRGFKSAEFTADQAPFRHPLGLMFAVAAFFRAQGVRITIQSESPPRSALGGSSVAAVALVAALSEIRRRREEHPPMDGRSTALLAQAIEESVAGVPCGFQDQLAAVFGGVNAWNWQALPQAAVYRREVVIPSRQLQHFEQHLLAAYVGVPHVSSDVNGRWIHQFVSGRRRREWVEIVSSARLFAQALRRQRYGEASAAMTRETDLRRRMTPDVLDSFGRRLAAEARRCGCGARFAGAGGGGCIWAIGEIDAINHLRPLWKEILAKRPGAHLLKARVAREGLITSS